MPPSAYYEDVLLQATAAAYAAEFDKQSLPKPIEVIEAQVIRRSASSATAAMKR